jgi:hypothetical protein
MDWSRVLKSSASHWPWLESGEPLGLSDTNPRYWTSQGAQFNTGHSEILLQRWRWVLLTFFSKSEEALTGMHYISLINIQRRCAVKQESQELMINWGQFGIKPSRYRNKQCKTKRYCLPPSTTVVISNRRWQTGSTEWDDTTRVPWSSAGDEVHRRESLKKMTTFDSVTRV